MNKRPGPINGQLRYEQNGLEIFVNGSWSGMGIYRHEIIPRMP